MNIELHPEFLNNNGQKEFVILPYAEFELIKESLEDLEDLRNLREAKLSSMYENTISLDNVKKEFGL